MKSLLLAVAMLASSAAFAQGAKVDAKAAKAECRAEAKKAGKHLSKAELKDCVAGKTK